MSEKILIKEEDLEKQQDGSYKIKNSLILKDINEALLGFKCEDRTINSIKELILIEPFLIKDDDKFKISTEYQEGKIIVNIIPKKVYSSDYDISGEFRTGKRFWWSLFIPLLILDVLPGLVYLIVWCCTGKAKFKINSIKKNDEFLIEQDETKTYILTLKNTEDQIKRIVKENNYPWKVEKYILDKVKKIKKEI